MKRVLVDTSAWVEKASPDSFDGAVSIYRTCRAQGITPRGLIDCMIASVAIRAEATLLAFDRDLAAIATVKHLHLDEASLSA